MKVQLYQEVGLLWALVSCNLICGEEDHKDTIIIFRVAPRFILISAAMISCSGTQIGWVNFGLNLRSVLGGGKRFLLQRLLLR